MDSSRTALTIGDSILPRTHKVESDEDGEPGNRGTSMRSRIPRVKAERFGTASIRGSVVPDTQLSGMIDNEEED